MTTERPGLSEREREAMRRADGNRNLVSWLRRQAADRNGLRALYAVRTFCENAAVVAEKLEAEGIETWCPLKKVVKRLPRRQGGVTVDMSVFPFYFFVRLVDFDAAFLGVMTFGGVDCLLGNGEKPTSLSAKDIEKINGFRQEKADRSRIFTRGDRAVITDGPFRDHEGMVITDEDEANRVALELEIFGQMVPCRMGIDDLKKIT